MVYAEFALNLYGTKVESIFNNNLYFCQLYQNISYIGFHQDRECIILFYLLPKVIFIGTVYQKDGKINNTGSTV